MELVKMEDANVKLIIILMTVVEIFLNINLFNFLLKIITIK